MNKIQWLVLALSATLVILLYFVFDIVPPKTLDLEKSRSQQIESTGIDNLERNALQALGEEQKSVIEAMQLDFSKAADSTRKMVVLRSLSGTWYEYGQPAIAGYYAEKVAEMEKGADAWSIAGTTYALCYKQTEDEKTKSFCWKRAVKAFEAAISIDPNNVDSRINLAICYTDVPQPDNPMQGVLMLRALNEQFPGNVQVLNQLARLALQTGQLDKALERLSESLKVDADNSQTACLMAEVLEKKGDATKAEEFRKKCVH